MPESVFTHDHRSTVRISAETRGLQAPLAHRTQKELKCHINSWVLGGHFFY